MAYGRAVALLLASFLVFSTEAQSRPRKTRPIGRAPQAWRAPACGTVQGLRSMWFIKDGGVLAQNETHARNQAVTSIAASDKPNVLYASYYEDLYESRDAGCTWTQRAHLGPVTSHGWFIVLARADRIYLHDWETLLRVTAAGVESLPLPGRMLEVLVNPRNTSHLRTVAGGGQTFESLDGGESWTALGVASGSLYVVRADPADFDHLLAESGIYGVSASFDGGRTWTRSGALQGVNAFYLEFSAADPRVVWASGVKPGEGFERIYRSIDGGMTFAPVLDSRKELSFARANLAPHPRNPDLLAFRSHDGVAVYDHAAATASVIAPRFTSSLRSLTWSPAGTLYFAAPNEIVITDP